MSFIVHYMTGVCGHTDQFRFDNQEDGLAWSDHVSEIKIQVASVNTKFQASRKLKDDEAVRDEGYLGWMKTVEAFVRKWGGERLPRDIGDAYEDIKENVKVGHRGKDN